LVKTHKASVAIFGGSFDPPHKAHQKIVDLALEKLDIEYLLVVPTYLNPFKDSWHTPPSKRLEWCEKIFANNPRVLVQDYEIKEQKSVPTYQSINHFNKKYTVKYLIVGSDNLSKLTKWYNFKWLNEHITWVIFTRDGYEIDTSYLKNYKIISMDIPISSTDIRDKQIVDMVDDTIKESVIQTLRKKMTLDERIANIIKVLDDKKAEDIEVFNLEDADYIASRVVIANSLNSKHTIALYDSLKDELKPKGESFLHSDISDDWVVADLGDILIHIMIPEYRQRYSLEEFLNELVSKKA